MIVNRIAPTKPIINLLHHHHLHLLSTNSTHPTQPSNPITIISPPNPDHLLQVCTILYQQQDSPEPRPKTPLQAPCLPLASHNLTKTTNSPTSSSSQVCNKFPYSWQPVYHFFQYTEANTTSHFTHTSVSFNKLLNVIGKSRNIELFLGVSSRDGTTSSGQ
ncbi:hypothetical protein CMV_026522 [Castanea mollissima]|uniref:Uncharacterized protein n=1 Tax=Castanea mollissima TaxID=60419 RepID=A0A8J4QB33_9ROSI|nr:hypothetical protein CMV_026522 [Castanea mollissima]